jgi:hypothetical protein
MRAERGSQELKGPKESRAQRVTKVTPALPDPKVMRGLSAHRGYMVSRVPRGRQGLSAQQDRRVMRPTQ